MRETISVVDRLAVDSDRIRYEGRLPDYLKDSLSSTSQFITVLRSMSEGLGNSLRFYTRPQPNEGTSTLGTLDQEFKTFVEKNSSIWAGYEKTLNDAEEMLIRQREMIARYEKEWEAKETNLAERERIVAIREQEVRRLRERIAFTCDLTQEPELRDFLQIENTPRGEEDTASEEGDG